MQSEKPKKSKSISLRIADSDYIKLAKRAAADQRTVSNYLLKLIHDDLYASDRMREAMTAIRVAEDAVAYKAGATLHDPPEDDGAGH